MGPDYLGPHNLYFASLNRNKRSLSLDLASPEGQKTLHDLVAGARGLIVNLRPSAIRKLGLTYEALRAHNPKIACVALTGYGLEGPNADRPAYDYVIQGLTGLMSLTGNPGDPPTRAGYAAADNSTGIMAALALLAKILSGQGGQVDVALYDVLLSQLNYLAAARLNGGAMPERLANGAHPYLVPAQTFASADGHIVLFISHDKFWRRFAEAVGKPEWLTDERFATVESRFAYRELVVAEVQEVLSRDSTENWLAHLLPHDIVVSAVDNLDDALASPLTAQRDMVVAVETEDGPIRMLGTPIKIAGFQPQYKPPPLLGEDNDTLSVAGKI
jgi:crotonobetainyl-CoA:carnitine CoA-transferase CaiB-like acyl-CoA transferase